MIPTLRVNLIEVASLLTACLLVSICGCRTSRHDCTLHRCGPTAVRHSVVDLDQPPFDSVEDLADAAAPQEVADDSTSEPFDDTPGSIDAPLPQPPNASPAERVPFDKSVPAALEPKLDGRPPSVSKPTPLATREELLAQLQKIGANVGLDNGGAVIAVDLSFRPCGDDLLEQLYRFDRIQRLNLTGTKITDAGLVHVGVLETLQSLKLRGTVVSDNGMQHVSRLKNLELFDLSKTAVSDVGLVQLKPLSNLKYLLLGDTTVSDAGLEHLADFTNLSGLSLIGTKVTEKGVAKLTQALPNCRIYSKLASEQSSTPVPLEYRNSVVVNAVPDLPKPRVQRYDGEAAALVRLAAQKPELAVKLAELYSSEGKWWEAVQILGAGVNAKPNDAMLKFRLGVALAKTGDTETALPYLQQTVGEAAAHYNLGVIVYESMLQKCEQFFARTLAVDPEFTIARHWLDEVRGELSVVNISNAPPESRAARSSLPEIRSGPTNPQAPEPASRLTSNPARKPRPGDQMRR